MDRLAVPRRGHVLSTVAERYGAPIREAVAILEDVIRTHHGPNKYVELFEALPDSGDGVIRSIYELSAWRIVSAWVSAVAVKAVGPDATLIDSDSWFFASRQSSLKSLLPEKSRAAAERTLRTNADPHAYYELLPYILDPHGPGSRLSVRRDPKTRDARNRKRAEGVFYTPADVAEYMAFASVDSVKADIRPVILDPACGTGVFLRASLKALRHQSPDDDVFALACTSLYGVDIDPLALDASAFVLLADSWPPSHAHAASERWSRLRKNLSCIDTLRLDPSDSADPAISALNEVGSRNGRVSLTELFPALERAPNIVLGNPPYSNLGKRTDLPELSCALKTVAARPQPNAEIYVSFIEQMIRLTSEGVSAGALVLPLSIACNVSAQFAATRELIGRTPGEWRFAFFDREPHALFGEDVKTRNAIVLWSRQTARQTTTLATGPLRKWRGDNRAAMFASLQFTRLDSQIRVGIPKIEGDAQAEALKTLEARSAKFSQAVAHINRVPLRAAMSGDNKTVFVGPTAYNFLNVFLTPGSDVLQADKTLSEHPIHAVQCASREDAFRAFAILSSHLAYWWWHAHGDGFHVSGRFIDDLPFGPETFAGSAGIALCKAGKDLWRAIRARPIISLNGGRTSLAYTPNGHDAMRRKSDEVLAKVGSLSTGFVDELQKFTARSVSARLHETSVTKMEQL